MLSRSEILIRTNNGLDVFRHFINDHIVIGKKFKNPLYDDKNASCNVYFDHSKGVYKLKDFGNDSYSGDCFAFVAMLCGLDCNNKADFLEVLSIINRELNLGLTTEAESYINLDYNKRPGVRPSVPIPVKPVPRPYHYREKKLTTTEFAIFRQYGITEETLKRYNVISVAEFSSHNKYGKPFTFLSTHVEPMFGYVRKEFIKIYRPFSEIRFLYGGKTESPYTFGMEQLPVNGENLFITGGEKDVMTLAAHGFNAICFGSETVNLPEEIIKELTTRFNNVILLYDADQTGIESSVKHQKQYSKYNLKRLILPLKGTKEEKDISDYFRKGNTVGGFNSLCSYMLIYE